MKKLLYILLFVPIALFGQENNLYHIADSAFLGFLEENHPKVITNDSLNIDSALTISKIMFSGYSNIESLDGLQYFSNLDTLSTSSLYQLTSYPDLSNLSSLVSLQLWSLPFSNLPIDYLSGLNNLSGLSIQYCPYLTNLPNLSSLSNLRTFAIYDCPELVSIPDLPNSINHMGWSLL